MAAPSSSPLSSVLSSAPSSLGSTTSPAPSPAPAPPAEPNEEELQTHVRLELPPGQRPSSVLAQHFVKESFNLRVMARKEISNQSKFKVPKVLDSGVDENGLAFIKTEVWPGIPYERVKDECRMPDGEKHIDTGGECTKCEEKAWFKAECYFSFVVVPAFGNGLTVVHPEFGEKITIFITPDHYLFMQLWVRDVVNNNLIYKMKTKIGFQARDIMFEPGTLDVIGIYDWHCRPELSVLPADGAWNSTSSGSISIPKSVIRDLMLNPRPDTT